jgi:hypothetical protein
MPRAGHMLRKSQESLKLSPLINLWDLHQGEVKTVAEL